MPDFDFCRNQQHDSSDIFKEPNSFQKL